MNKDRKLKNKRVTGLQGGVNKPFAFTASGTLVNLNPSNIFYVKGNLAF